VVKSRESEGFEQVVEKIVFDEEELEELKIAIRHFTEGKIQAKQLKQKLLQSRGRMVKEISSFLDFCIDRVRHSSQNQDPRKNSDTNQFRLENNQLQKEITEKNELLETVAKKINFIVSGVTKS